jgi:hypothetical protein
VHPVVHALWNKGFAAFVTFRGPVRAFVLAFMPGFYDDRRSSTVAAAQ